MYDATKTAPVKTHDTRKMRLRLYYYLVLWSWWMIVTAWYMATLEQSRQVPLQNDNMKTFNYPWVRPICILSNGVIGSFAAFCAFCGGWSEYAVMLQFVYFWLFLGFWAWTDFNISWRQLELAERSLASGGETLTSCLTATNPQRIEVLPNTTYYTLADKEWHVDWSSRDTFSLNGWTWLSAPIVYDGPVAGCRFDPPIYAGCITEDVSPEGCGFVTTGPNITIRKLSQSHKLEAGTRKRIPYNGMVRNEYVMEWGSQTLQDIRDYVGRTNREADDLWWNSVTVWGLVSGVPAVIVAFLDDSPSL